MTPLVPICLMYHELELPGRRTCHTEAGYLTYVVHEREFVAQLDHLQRQGFHGLSVGATLAMPSFDAPTVTFTFDDGCETDLIAAAPLLLERGFGATFYLVADWVGRPGFLSPAQVRELVSLGFEVGCHSMTHAYLDDLDGTGLTREIAQARDRLEQVVGQPVVHFSCPGGRWSRRVSRLVREAGYESMATSDIGTFTAFPDPFRLPRVSVGRELDVTGFMRLCQRRGLWRRRIKSAALSTAKSLLGNRTYEGLRRVLIRSH